jgi:hypothetical protein
MAWLAKPATARRAMARVGVLVATGEGEGVTVVQVCSRTIGGHDRPRAVDFKAGSALSTALLG